MKWIKDGLSIDETKVSALIISFYITLAFAMHQVYVAGDIADNLLMFLGYQLGAFTGIKIFEKVATLKRGEKVTFEQELERVKDDTPTLP